MKQFARCTNCRQWYACNFTTTVEIVTSRCLPKATLWCRRCVAEAEHRSQFPPAPPDVMTLSPPEVAESALAGLTATEHAEPSDFQRLLQEHTALMERAIHEDDAVLVSLVEDFMQQCRGTQGHLEHPEHIQRLTGHVQYWEAFLKALHQAP